MALLRDAAVSLLHRAGVKPTAPGRSQAGRLLVTRPQSAPRARRRPRPRPVAHWRISPTYASPHGSAFLDRELYLPKTWVEDMARREAAGVPVTVAFQTKPQLARAMLTRAFAAAVPAAWITGDEIYGNDGSLRRWLEREQRPYVLTVAGSQPVWDRGRPRRVDAVGRADSGEGVAAPRRWRRQQRSARL